jgi:hypothetical protein
VSTEMHELIPGFSCYYPFVPTYVLCSIHPMGDLPIEIFQEMARHIPGIKEIKPSGNRYELHVAHNQYNSSEQIATMLLFAEEVRRYFEPIKVGHPFTGDDSFYRQPVPGFTITVPRSNRRHTMRDEPIERVEIRCPAHTAYVGDDRIKALATTVPGVDRIFTGDYSNPDRLTVYVAKLYQNKMPLVIGMLLTQLRRVFPMPNDLPVHSPLHHEPLTLADLEVGMTITRHRGGNRYIETATVTGIVQDEHGATVIVLDETRHVLAADLGLCLYATNGEPTHWSDAHYTLLSSTSPTTD